MACIELQKVNGVATAIIVDGVACPLPPAVICEDLPALPIPCPPDTAAMAVTAAAWVTANGAPNTLYVDAELGTAVLACGDGDVVTLSEPRLVLGHGHLAFQELTATITEVVPGRHYRHTFPNGAVARTLLDGRMTAPVQFPTTGVPGVNWQTADVDVTSFATEFVKLPEPETPNGCKQINAVAIGVYGITDAVVTVDGQWQDPAGFGSNPFGAGAGWETGGGAAGLPPAPVTGDGSSASWVRLKSLGAQAGDHLTGIINNQDGRENGTPDDVVEVNARLLTYEPVDVWKTVDGDVVCIANASGVALPTTTNIFQSLSCGTDGGNDVAVVSDVARSASGQLFARSQHTSINYSTNVSNGHPGQLIQPGAWRTILFDPATTDVNSDDSSTLGASAVGQIGQGIILTTGGHGVYSVSLQIWIDAQPNENIQTQLIRFNSPFLGTAFSERLGTAGNSFLARSYEVNARQGIEFGAQIRLFQPATIQFAQFKVTKVNDAVGYP